MQVTCPNCGARVTASNINIQNMTAVCAACDTVFPFNLPAAKVKRRKSKQPANLAIRDDDTLEIEFRTNFRLDKNEALIASLLTGFGLMMTVVTMLLFGDGDSPLILTGSFFVVALMLFYSVALIVLNKTHIKMDEESIAVKRRPLPNPLSQGHEFSLAGVTAIRYEETAVSKREAYDTPRYIVWAETEDGSRRVIVNDVIEDYAVYIAQRLDERLQASLDPDTSRLEDSGYDEDAADLNEIVEKGQRGRGV
ncbi:MAG: hypothetical protein LCI00_11475 [Chloroflexi bacterium]|nr:hypothetical protein [Chloroflexota bacterium]